MIVGYNHQTMSNTESYTIIHTIWDFIEKIPHPSREDVVAILPRFLCDSFGVLAHPVRHLLDQCGMNNKKNNAVQILQACPG